MSANIVNSLRRLGEAMEAAQPLPIESFQLETMTYVGNIDFCLAAGYRGIGCFSVAALPVKPGSFARCAALTLLA